MPEASSYPNRNFIRSWQKRTEITAIFWKFVLALKLYNWVELNSVRQWPGSDQMLFHEAGDYTETCRSFLSMLLLVYFPSARSDSLWVKKSSHPLRHILYHSRKSYFLHLVGFMWQENIHRIILAKCSTFSYEN